MQEKDSNIYLLCTERNTRLGMACRALYSGPFSQKPPSVA
ncbi:hypothetical protein C2W63_02388 [Bacillus velezensis]|nr:hypothetical protein C2W63_02388 [Bacillus velezensis]RUR97996.1 hypothetical protein EFW57_02370 [Bacillus velezensis]